MPGISLDLRDVEHLKSEIAGGRAPKGVKSINSASDSGNHFTQIDVKVDPTAEIGAIQTWILQSLAQLNKTDERRIRESIIRFHPKTYFDGPVAVTFSPDDGKNRGMIKKINAAYAEERKKYGL